MKGGFRFTWRDLAAGLVLSSVVAIVCTTMATGLSEQDKRVRCAANLRQIGDAVRRYRAGNGEAFPRTAFTFGDPVTPTWGTPYAAGEVPGPVAKADPFDAASLAAVGPADVTAALFLLVREEGVKPATFVCPSTDATPFDFDGPPHSAAEWTNWPGAAGIRAHLSYALSNPYGSLTAATYGFHIGPTAAATYALVGDLGPGGDAEVELTPTSVAAAVRQANSPNHHGDGQNLLYGDGHVDFAATPFAGGHGDNVYTAGGSECAATWVTTRKGPARLTASPVDGDDSILLPEASDLK